ncbi:MAG: hypothetical protein ACHBN1_30895 [Heteroscytonema crispum UTEX LB 1556]
MKVILIAIGWAIAFGLSSFFFILSSMAYQIYPEGRMSQFTVYGAITGVIGGITIGLVLLWGQSAIKLPYVILFTVIWALSLVVGSRLGWHIIVNGSLFMLHCSLFIVHCSLFMDFRLLTTNHQPTAPNPFAMNALTLIVRHCGQGGVWPSSASGVETTAVPSSRRGMHGSREWGKPPLGRAASPTDCLPSWPRW